MFDVFLSHTSADKPAVEIVARWLRSSAGLRVFLDKWSLPPGTTWQDDLASALERSSTVAVFVGPNVEGPWVREERRIATDRAARSSDDFRLIPVLLPGADLDTIDPFLRQRTWVDFRGGLDDDEALGRLKAGILGEPIEVAGFDLPDEPAPYRGLLAFQSEHRQFYFGRHDEIELTKETLRRQRFVAIVGASGSGKSSLLRAGVLPDICTTLGLDDVRQLTCRPGGEPFRSVAEQFAGLTSDAPRLRLVDELTQRFATRDDGMASALGALCGERTRSVVLAIDQFEELFTGQHTASAEQAGVAQRYVANLAALVSSPDPKVHLAITLRSDFLTEALAVPGFSELVQGRQVTLGALNESDVRAAIVEPARIVGAIFEKGLVNSVVRELSDEPGALPLLQHALRELWTRRRGPWLTVSAYEEIGGVSGALNRRATSTFESLPPERQLLARQILLRLVTLGDGVADTRRRVKRDELDWGDNDDEVDAVLAILSGEDARLIVIDQETVEISHEAILREWALLRAWIDEDRVALQVHRRITNAANDWASDGRPEELLLRGGRLAEAREWASMRRSHLAEIERSFIDAGERAEAARLDADEQRARTLRRRLVAASVALVFALLGGAVAVWAMARANESADEQRRIGAQARSRELASLAIERVRTAPETAALLALESLRVTESVGLSATPETRQALFASESSPWRATIRPAAPVTTVAFSPDGSLLATAEESGATELWNLDGGEPTTLRHDGVVNSVVFSPDGSLLATASADGTARLWDAAGREVERLTHDAPVNTVAFSPDGSQVVTASDDSTARLWTVTGTPGRAFALDQEVASADFSPNGSQVALRERFGALVVRDLEGPGRIDVDGVFSFSFNDDGSLIATSASSGVEVWTADGERVARLIEDGSSATTVEFEPGGNLFVMGMGDDAWWDIEAPGASSPVPTTHEFAGAQVSRASSLVAALGTGGSIDVFTVGSELLASLQHGDTEVRSVTFDASGTTLASIGGDGTVKLWDLTGGSATTFLDQQPVPDGFDGAGNLRVTLDTMSGTPRLHSAGGVASDAFPGLGWTSGVNVGADATLIVTVPLPKLPGSDESGDDTADDQNDSPALWTGDGRLISTLEGGEFVESIVLDPTGAGVVTTHFASAAQLWTAEGKRTSTFGDSTAAVQVGAFSPDGELFAGLTETSVRIWTRDGTPVEAIDLDNEADGLPLDARSAQFSAAGSLFAVTIPGIETVVWERGSGRVHRLDGYVSGSAPFSADGSTIATLDPTGAAGLWTSDGSYIGPLAHGDGRVSAVVFNPVEPRAVSIGADGTAKLWTADGTFEATLGQSDPIALAAWSPDGALLATSSTDGTTTIWNADLEVIATFSQPGPVELVEFGPVGHRLVTGGQNGTRVTTLTTVDEMVDVLLLRLGARAFEPDECVQFHLEPCR